MHYYIHWNMAFIPVILEINQIPSLNTTQFAEAIINNFGKNPQLNAKALLPNMPAIQTVFKLEKNP